MMRRLQERDRDAAPTVDAAPDAAAATGASGADFQQLELDEEAQICKEGNECPQCTCAFAVMRAGSYQTAKTVYEKAAAQGHTRAQ
jgi:hypothetical protein